ncbi:MAG TPA: hypothetical protein VEF72_00395 [Mycobacterium sp.]|nr:hypothetical protein [Mycobacterium sp.]
MRNSVRFDPFAEHTRLVDEVASAGASPPGEWMKLRKRFRAFLDMGGRAPMQHRLVDAVVTGSDADIVALRAAAHAEQLEQPKVVAAVRDAILQRMQEVYRPVATEQYGKVVDVFDSAANKFTAAAQVINPETPAAEMVGASDELRRNWLDADILARQLTTLIGPLHAAARLTGTVPESAGRDGGGKDAVLLPLVCDPGELHRRRVWEAWEAKGRCGRWSALVAHGVRLRGWPADQLEAFGPYRPAKPLEERYEPVALGISERHLVDPEDPSYQEPEPVKPRRALAR